jgi:hypothetical protein
MKLMAKLNGVVASGRTEVEILNIIDVIVDGRWM